MDTKGKLLVFGIFLFYMDSCYSNGNDLQPIFRKMSLLEDDMRAMKDEVRRNEERQQTDMDIFYKDFESRLMENLVPKLLPKLIKTQILDMVSFGDIDGVMTTHQDSELQRLRHELQQMKVQIRHLSHRKPLVAPPRKTDGKKTDRRIKSLSRALKQTRKMVERLRAEKTSSTKVVPNYGKTSTLKPKEHIRAAHYMPDFWKDRTDLTSARTLCIYVDKWGGTACRNKTLEMKTGKMNFFYPAPWAEENDHLLLPAKQLNNGDFEITEDGLYLVYSSVLFYDSKLKESQAVTKNGQGLLKCMDGVDYVDAQHGGGYISKFKSCSISGVTYLRRGDRIAVESRYSKTVIDLSHDATFFGLVQLIPGPNHQHRHNHGT